MATCTQAFNSIVPALKIISRLRIPEPSEGNEGRELLELFHDSLIRSEDIPSRVVQLEAIPQYKDVPSQNNAAIELLRSWREGEGIEQKETWQYLKRAMDENRLASRKFFQ